MKTADLREFDFGSDYEIIPWGDTHIGNASTSWDTMDKFVRYVRERPNRFVTFGGDQFETVHIGDKRHDINLHDTRLSCFEDMTEAFVEQFEPIADRILYLMEGNHEIDYVKRGISQLTRAVEKEFDPPIRHPSPLKKGKGEAWYTVKALFPEWNMFQWHGPRRGTINSQAMDPDIQEENESRAVKKRLRRFGHNDCDVLVMHHIHKMRIRSPVKYLQLTTDLKTCKTQQHFNSARRSYIGKAKNEYIIDPHAVWYASSGAALLGQVEGTSGYAEEAGYGATELGTVKVVVRDDKVINVRKVIL